jgi:large subunit ribosomal protein L21
MAYAVFQTGSKQYRVSVGDVIDVDLLEGEQGKELKFSNVLLLGEGADLKIGQAVGSANVVAEVVEHYKGPKLVAYKYKRRKGYHRKVGFRRRLTKLKITSIGA